MIDKQQGLKGIRPLATRPDASTSAASETARPCCLDRGLNLIGTSDIGNRAASIHAECRIRRRRDDPNPRRKNR